MRWSCLFVLLAVWVLVVEQVVVTSLLLCFGAGVLLATALLHILPEVKLLLYSSPHTANPSLTAFSTMVQHPSKMLFF